MYAVSDLISLSNALVDGYGLMTTNNPGHDRGGNCSGDSGGPILWQDTDIIVAVNGFGLQNTCKGSDFSYRTDTETAHAFISSFLDQRPADDQPTTDRLSPGSRSVVVRCVFLGCCAARHNES